MIRGCSRGQSGQIEHNFKFLRNVTEKKSEQNQTFMQIKITAKRSSTHTALQNRTYYFNFLSTYFFLYFIFILFFSYFLFARSHRLHTIVYMQQQQKKHKQKKACSFRLADCAQYKMVWPRPGCRLIQPTGWCIESWQMLPSSRSLSLQHSCAVYSLEHVQLPAVYDQPL